MKKVIIAYLIINIINLINTSRKIEMSSQILSQRKNINSPIKIAFGSCFGQFSFQNDIFRAIDQYNPDIWIWLGDFAYTDRLSFPKINQLGDPQYIKQRFLKTYSDPCNFIHCYLNFSIDYKLFRERNNQRIILGTMDDHDYGLNNCDKDNPVKDFTKNIFLQLLNEPEDSPRWQDGRGLYEDYQIIYDNLTLRVILLDTRYYMQTQNRIFKHQNPPDFLGQEQWLWLQQIFKNAPRDQLTLIGSGVQFLQNNRYLPTESWHQHEKIRLLALIQKYQKSNVVILTGDIHSFQIYNTPCPLSGPQGYYLYEMTSSGMTHVGRQVFKLSDLLMQHMTHKEYFLTNLFMEHNFGVIQIETKGVNQSQMLMQIRNKKNQVQIQLKVDDLKQLRQFFYIIKTF